MNPALYAVIGDPVAHSLSPAMQNAALRTLPQCAEYLAVHVAPDDLESFVHAARTRLRGFNITVPHKQSILPYLDEISDHARLARSVNTVHVSPDGAILSGTSTDGIGLEHALNAQNAPSLRDETICFLGCGGVVPALAWHCAACGVREIRILNRTTEKAVQLTHELSARYPELRTFAGDLSDRVSADALRGARITVQCTSLGLRASDPPPVNPLLLDPDTYFFETVYKSTALWQAAERRSIRRGSGLDMLLYQGAESFRIWTGLEPPVDVMREALYRAAAPSA